MNQTVETTKNTETGPDALYAAELAKVQDMVRACMQCGTCTASCPNGFAMDLTPRAMWRLLLYGFEDEVFSSKTYWMCSSCYTCTLRCPRGLKLTSAMQAIKRLSALRDAKASRKHGLFYKTFIDNVEKWGRVQESDLMIRYFWRRKDPLLPLSYTGLGLKLMGKGKMHGPKGAHKGRLTAMFNKVKEMEGRS